MRFMGFSKSNFPARFAVLALVGAFVASLGVVALPSEAQARRGNVWSVKYKCSVDVINSYEEVIDLPYIGESNEFVVQTTVNIHNPTEGTVRFNKKVVIVEPQHANSNTEVSAKDGITLSANKAHSIDCLDIVDILTVDQGDPVINPEDFAVERVFEGFVVIESEKGRRIPDLAVCANYILAIDDVNTGQGASLHTECIEPIRVRFKQNFKFF